MKTKVEKTMLEKRITERAEQRFKEEYKKFFDFCRTNEFARLIEINGVFLSKDYQGKNYFKRDGCCCDGTNYEKAKAEVIKLYEQQETDLILKKLGEVSYIFKDNNDGEPF